jgi:hypothetical protein
LGFGHYYPYQTRNYSGDEEGSTADENWQVIGAGEHVAGEYCQQTGAGCRGRKHGTYDNHHYPENENVRSQLFSTLSESFWFRAITVRRWGGFLSLCYYAMALKDASRDSLWLPRVKLNEGSFTKNMYWAILSHYSW